MSDYNTATAGPSKAPPVLEFPQTAPLFRRLAAAMRGRRVAVVFPPGRDGGVDPAETFFIVRGDVIAELGLVDGAGGDFHDRHFGDFEVVS